MTAVGALFLLTPYTLVLEFITPGALLNNAELALVGFHSLFNLLGVLIILPFTGIFGRLIQRIIPDKADAYTKSLDKKLLNEPDLALTAAQSSIHIELKALLKQVNSMLDSNLDSQNEKVNMIDLRLALEETRRYIDFIHLEKNKEKSWDILLILIHSLDHMQRLYDRCEEDKDRASIATKTPELAAYISTIKNGLKRIMEDIDNNNWSDASACATEFAAIISEDAKHVRQKIAANIAEGKVDMQIGSDSLKAIRWLRRVSAHILRITYHQAKAQQQFIKN
jgi:phosphate:Na+ symporter